MKDPNPLMNQLDLEFAENPDPRCACVLVLDISGSMAGDPIDALSRGLAELRKQLLEDPVARNRVELSVVTFGTGATVAHDWATIEEFEPPELEAGGLTYLSEATQTALRLLEERKDTYRSAGVSYYRPWMLLMTDGLPCGEETSAVDEASRTLRGAMSDRKALVFPVAVGEGGDADYLESYSGAAARSLSGLRFAELFQWLSASLAQVSQSTPGDRVALPTLDSWSEVLG